MTKFHENSTKIVDFLLMAMFGPCPIFYASPSIILIIKGILCLIIVHTMVHVHKILSDIKDNFVWSIFWNPEEPTVHTQFVESIRNC